MRCSPVHWFPGCSGAVEMEWEGGGAVLVSNTFPWLLAFTYSHLLFFTMQVCMRSSHRFLFENTVSTRLCPARVIPSFPVGLTVRPGQTKKWACLNRCCVILHVFHHPRPCSIFFLYLSISEGISATLLFVLLSISHARM